MECEYCNKIRFFVTFVGGLVKCFLRTGSAIISDDSPIQFMACMETARHRRGVKLSQPRWRAESGHLLRSDTSRIFAAYRQTRPVPVQRSYAADLKALIAIAHRL